MEVWREDRSYMDLGVAR